MLEIHKILKWTTINAKIMKTTQRADLEAILEVRTKVAVAIINRDLIQLSTEVVRTEYLKMRDL